jgi:hypothetical protein
VRGAVSGGLLALIVTCSSTAKAGPWTRDQGHFYLNTSYSRIATDHYYGPDFHVVPILPYTQQVVGVYGEVGILSRWLTATVEGTLYRRNAISGQGYTEGVGDWRVGVWTGLVEKPVHLGFGLTVGIPVGDRAPSAGPGADPDAQQIARSLPTGDGEWDVEARLALGHSFGGVKRWPVRQYVAAEAGYWLRTRGIADAFVYKLQLGTNFPWKFIERFWIIARLTGVESFASNADAARDATGLGNGVTFIAPGLEVYGRIWRGLGAALAVDGALRARSVAAGEQLKVAVSYQW